MPPADLINEENRTFLRFLRSNYEAFISAWTERMLQKTLAEFNMPVVTLRDSRLQLDFKIFEFIGRFSEVC